MNEIKKEYLEQAEKEFALEKIKEEKITKQTSLLTKETAYKLVKLQNKLGNDSTLIELFNANILCLEQQKISITDTAIKCAYEITSLRLSLNKTFGQAYVINYSNIPQLQIGYKGYIQLFIRSGQIRTINALTVYEKDIVVFDSLTKEPHITWNAEQDEDKVKGYYAVVQLMNGYTKTIYWSKEKMDKFARKYSKSYLSNGFKYWGLAKDNSDYEQMAWKTLIKQLAKWTPMSVEFKNVHKASSLDMASFDENGKLTYLDNPINQDESEENGKVITEEEKQVLESAHDE